MYRVDSGRFGSSSRPIYDVTESSRQSGGGVWGFLNQESWTKSMIYDSCIRDTVVRTSANDPRGDSEQRNWNKQNNDGRYINSPMCIPRTRRPKRGEILGKYERRRIKRSNQYRRIGDGCPRESALFGRRAGILRSSAGGERAGSEGMGCVKKATPWRSDKGLGG